MTETPITVSQALAAHAAAQVTAAQQADDVRREGRQPPVKPHCTSFTIGWADVAMCIGFRKPRAG